VNGIAPTSWWITRSHAYWFILIPLAVCVVALVGAPGALAAKYIASGFEFGEVEKLIAETIGRLAALLVAYWFCGWWFRRHQLN
jgi:hypothetical protein